MKKEWIMTALEQATKRAERLSDKTERATIHASNLGSAAERAITFAEQCRKEENLAWSCVQKLQRREIER